MNFVYNEVFLRTVIAVRKFYKAYIIQIDDRTGIFY